MSGEDTRWQDLALEVHRRLPVAAGYFEYYGYDSLFREEGAAYCDLAKLDAAHVRVFGIALANGGAGYFDVGPDEFLPAGDADWAFERLLRFYDAALAETMRCPRVRVVRTVADLPVDAEDPHIRVLPLVTSHTWMRDLAAVDTLFARGLRISHCAGLICKTWNRSYPTYRVKGDQGPVLNAFGRDVIAHMNELGMILDVAHMSDESTEAILDVSVKPIVDGHTGSRTVIPHGRGHADSTLRKIAEKGGVAGIHFADHLFCPRVWGVKYHPAVPEAPNPIRAWNQYLLDSTKDPDERMRLRKDRAAQERFYREHNVTPPPPASEERMATISDMADHVEHLVNVMGIDHVALGGDVNGITAHSWPAGCDHVGELPALSAELLGRGWPEADLGKFLSENWLRVWRECLPPAGGGLCRG
ncbi:MAG: membrane dipeptidase [Verrucomicrobiota bacterium]